MTAGARLLLSVAERLVHDAGGEVAYCDTDSLFIVATKDSALVPCTNGPYVLQDGRRAVRALPRAQVDEIFEHLTALKVYDLAGSAFKLEDVNRDARGNRREVWFYGTREKSYALFEIDRKGTVIPVKTSGHTIGQYRSPYPDDRKRRWIGEAWQYAVCVMLGRPVEAPPWLDLPATSQLTLSTNNLMTRSTFSPSLSSRIPDSCDVVAPHGRRVPYIQIGRSGARSPGDASLAGHRSTHTSQIRMKRSLNATAA